MKRQIFAGITLLLLSINAHALYFTFGGGPLYSMRDLKVSGNTDAFLGLSPLSVQLTEFSWENEFEPGVEATAAIGFVFANYWRGEFEFLYQNTQRELDGSYNYVVRGTTTNEIILREQNNTLHSIDSLADIYSLFCNILYDFRNNSRFTPYVGAGIGVTWINSEGTNVNDHIVFSDGSVVQTIEHGPGLESAALAWQAKFGVSYDISPTATLQLQYRLLGTSDFDSEQSNVILNPGIPGLPAAITYRMNGQTTQGLLISSLDVLIRFNA